MPYARSDLSEDGILFGLPFPALRRWGLNENETAALAAILVLTSLVYARSLWDGFVYDDFPYIAFNHQLHHWSFAFFSWTRDVWWFRDPGNLPQSPYYRPVQNTFLALAFPIAGKNPLLWHLIKIALHLGVVVLVFRFSKLLTANVATALLASCWGCWSAPRRPTRPSPTGWPRPSSKPSVFDVIFLPMSDNYFCRWSPS